MTQTPSHLHDLHLQVFMERWSDSDGLQHLAEQLLLQDLGLRGSSSHKAVLTQQLLMGGRQSYNTRPDGEGGNNGAWTLPASQ